MNFAILAMILLEAAALAPMLKADVTLVDIFPNTTVTICESGSSNLACAGKVGGEVIAYKENGLDQLSEISFWYRTPAGTGTASAIPFTLVSSNVNSAVFTYSKKAVAKVDLTYSLADDPSGLTSFLTMNLKVTNLKPSGSLAIDIFGFYDFDLLGTTSGQTVIYNNVAHEFTQTKTGSGTTVLADALNGTGLRYEASIYPGAKSSFTGTAGYNLSNVGSSGSGDVTFAFQWTKTIPRGGSAQDDSAVTLSSPTPEPASLILTGAGLALAALLRRRRARL